MLLEIHWCMIQATNTNYIDLVLQAVSFVFVYWQHYKYKNQLNWRPTNVDPLLQAVAAANHQLSDRQQVDSEAAGEEDEAARWQKITKRQNTKRQKDNKTKRQGRRGGKVKENHISLFFLFSFSSFPFFFLLLFWGKWRGRGRKVKKITFLCFFLLLFEVKVTDGDRLSLEEDWI